MPRPIPPITWQECPRCRYPMTRWSELAGEKEPLWDALNLADSWLPLNILIPGGLLALVLTLLPTDMTSVLVDGPRLPLWLVEAGAVSLLAAEVLMLWKLRQRLRARWRSLVNSWQASARNHRDGWQGDSLWTKRRDSSAGGGGGAAITLFMLLPAAGLWIMDALPFVLGLSDWAAVCLLYAAGLGVFLMPEFLALGVQALQWPRQLKRQKLRRHLLPDELVCARCLHAKRARTSGHLGRRRA